MILLVVSACSRPDPEPIEIRTRPVDVPELVFPEADPVRTRPVEWTIITEENYEEVFERLRSSNRDVALFGLTDRGYENLALNLNDLRTFIQQQNSIIMAYRNFYIRTQGVLGDAVVVE